MNIILPAMGEGVIEATINKWLVAEGAAVREDDPLVEVATDKVDTEIPAPSDGIIVSVIAKEGSVIKVGETIAILEKNTLPLPGESERIEKEVERIRDTIAEIKKESKEVEAVSVRSEEPDTFRKIPFTPGKKHCRTGKYKLFRTGQDKWHGNGWEDYKR